MTTPNPGTALIVDDELTNRLILKSLVKKQGYDTIEAVNGQEAIDLFRSESPSIIFMDVMMPEVDGYEATMQIKAETGNRFVPIIFLTAMTDEESLNRCIEAGGDDFMVKPYDKFILQTKIRAMQRITALNKEIEGMYSMIHREQEIAESVFINAIQGTNISNPNINATIRPAGTFSGDMLLSAYSPSRDLYFLIGDFTGHGLSAALGAMPVSEVFHAMTSKGFSPGEVLLGINKKLKALLPVGMFFGVQLVVVNYELEHALIFNAGMPDTLLIDGASNQIKRRYKSKGLPLGITADIDPKEISEYVPINPNDKILMFSDGLTEARNAEDEEFGEARLHKAISNAAIDGVYKQIFSELDQFCGDMTQVDDVTLVELNCVDSLLPQIAHTDTQNIVKKSASRQGEWKMTLNFKGSRLRETNPVPIVVNQIMELEELESERQSLFTAITELYVNALDHGVLRLDSSMKQDAVGFARYFEERKTRLENLDCGHVCFELCAEQFSGARRIILRVED
ncbi:MAG: fused response regulator/phosphatase, partial [Gammaproteobacteria bacterium]|nr:fused response regulator/phosphatase [Gammaproteobacteria bacterium]